jgi:hypothetical protein
MLGCLLLWWPLQVSADEGSWSAFQADLPEGWSAREKEFVGDVGSKLSVWRSPDGTVASIAMIDARRILTGFSAQSLKQVVEAYVNSFWATLHRSHVGVQPWGCALQAPKWAPLYGLRFHLDNPDGPWAYACGVRDVEQGWFLVVVAWPEASSQLDAEQTRVEVERAMSSVSLLASPTPVELPLSAPSLSPGSPVVPIPP